jgi:two-component system cell cycle response regulator
VDHFKQINDQYGHLAGDAVLEEIATRLAKALRDYDVIGRYGGEEFVVGVKVSEPKSRDIGQRLRKAVNGSPIVGKNFSVDITISIGGQLIYPDDEFDTLNEVIEYADQALYRAKKNGRDQVELSSSAMPTKRRINR